MKCIEGKIWLEVADWEMAGVKYSTVQANLSSNRKSWQSIITQGKGRETLFLYESLNPKHKVLFEKAVKQFLAEQEAIEAKQAIQSLTEKILACVQIRPQDILYFQERGFVAEKIQKSTLYARRAAWLRFLAEITPKEIKTNFAPLRSKEEFLSYCLPLIHAENCFYFRNPNLQYLKIRLVQWNKYGLESCIDARNGKQNALKIKENTEKLLLSLITSIKKPTLQEVYEIYSEFLQGKIQLTCTETGEIYNPAEYTPIAYSTLHAFASRLQNKAVYTLAHGTKLSYRTAHDFYAKRKRPEYFGSMITCDDWDVNINVQIKIAGKLYKKVYAYLFFDVATRHCVGYAWGFEKTRDLFLNALRNTLLNDCWQGKMPYELQGESNLLKAINESVLKELFAETKILPQNPMAKYAERDIHSLKYDVFAKDKEYKDYFKGRHYGKREAWRLEKDLQNSVKAFTETAEIEKFLQKIVATYNELHPISAPLHPELLAQNPERLAFHLAEPIKTSYRNGRLQANNEEWIFLNIERLKHKHVEVRMWQGVAYVYQDGVFLGTAEPLQAAQVSKLEATEEDGKIKGRQLQTQRKLRAKVAEQVQKTEKINYEKIFEQARKQVFDKQEQEIDIYSLAGEQALKEKRTA